MAADPTPKTTTDAKSSARHFFQPYLPDKLTKDDFDFIPNLILLGDSVLDNIGWIDEDLSENDVEKQLNTALKQIDKLWTAKATNLALDGATSHTLLRNLTVRANDPLYTRSLHKYLLKQSEDDKIRIKLSQIAINNENNNSNDTTNDQKEQTNDKIDAWNQNNPKNDSIATNDKTDEKETESDEIDANNSKSRKNIVILSIGGNDVLGKILGNFYGLLGNSSATSENNGNIDDIGAQMINEMNRSQFGTNYRKILDIIINECDCNVIMVLCYEPHIKFLDDYEIERMQLMNIIEWGAKQLFEIENEYNVPIIDLSRTSDPKNDLHYSQSSPIEPNEKMGSFLVDLVLFCLKDFKQWKRIGLDKNENENENENNEKKAVEKMQVSKIYYGHFDDGNEIKVEKNNKEARNNYLKSKLKLSPL